MSNGSLKVSEVARIAGVTVRMLHHYDEIGLLVPSGRSAAGYRLYSTDDLLRLHQIVVGRSLGLPLQEIRAQLDSPETDRVALLRRHRAALSSALEQTHAKIRAVDAALTALAGRSASGIDFRALFDGFDPADYELEAAQHWGDTPAYAEASRRTGEYTTADWERQRAEQAEIFGAAAALLASGSAPDAEASRAVAERHRLHIDRWFYPCSRVAHAGLASMYREDPRFAATFDAYRAGLSTFFAAAVEANAAGSAEARNA